ncbi:DSS1/SEM1 family-domain-containing protein [Clohesyomyces aquaticus]|uniref:26S proteasome complex subunit SEM1 n=1 Tax=Clohesyomyces aquaticus TaxID=1231657 RepID=A0A1Y1Y2P0_9PLEO|nr:DSS1/SEM1 family-domain-containing protein [Clohesyomyces aquaticus]
MSAQPSSKPGATDPKADAPASKDAQKPAAQLEEDDEFEDFPVEDWPEEETQLPGGNAHLWEESWDDDDTNEDFAVQLREELKKLGQK